MKIITFTKNNQFQALLQFSDPVNAQQAKLVGLRDSNTRNPKKSSSFLQTFAGGNPNLFQFLILFFFFFARTIHLHTNTVLSFVSSLDSLLMDRTSIILAVR